MKKQFKDMSDEEKKAHYEEKVKVCPDFAMNSKGGCVKWQHTNDKKIMYCDYVKKDEMEDDHFICEFSLEYAHKLVKK